MTPRPAAVDRVEKALRDLGAQGQIRELTDSARTAKEAAAALGVEVGQIASSLVFLADSEPVMVVASGAHRVDESLLGELVGATIGKANASDVRAATGYVIGGVSPVDLPPHLRVIIDEALGQYDEVWAAAGHTHWVFPTSFDELVRMTGGQPAAVGD
jgi:prolyl-tRNA editing enzyme YbaK/EbsC (Cys-tRNA(Pro) deacylase)